MQENNQTKTASVDPIVIRSRWRRAIESPVILFKHYKVARQYAGVFKSIRIAVLFWKISVRRYG